MWNIEKNMHDLVWKDIHNYKLITDNPYPEGSIENQEWHKEYISIASWLGSNCCTDSPIQRWIRHHYAINRKWAGTSGGYGGGMYFEMFDWDFSG